MEYHTYQAHSDLQALISCYWTLEIPANPEVQKQRIVPDGCIEMAFILGDDIKRFVSENDYILQPRAMILGQTIEPLVSVPIVMAQRFAETATPDPELDPHGFRSKA